VVAAPVRLGGDRASGAAPRLAGVVAVAAPVARLPELGIERVARRTVAAADRIAARLEGRSL
jgi:DNA-binding IclR family transcriptional regulator